MDARVSHFFSPCVFVSVIRASCVTSLFIESRDDSFLETPGFSSLTPVSQCKIFSLTTVSLSASADTRPRRRERPHWRPPQQDYPPAQQIDPSVIDRLTKWRLEEQRETHRFWRCEQH